MGIQRSKGSTQQEVQQRSLKSAKKHGKQQRTQQSTHTSLTVLSSSPPFRSPPSLYAQTPAPSSSSLSRVAEGRGVLKRSLVSNIGNATNRHDQRRTKSTNHTAPHRTSPYYSPPPHSRSHNTHSAHTTSGVKKRGRSSRPSSSAPSRPSGAVR